MPTLTKSNRASINIKDFVNFDRSTSGRLQGKNFERSDNFRNLNFIVISIASNYDQEENLAKAHQDLDKVLPDIRYTSAIWTQPFGSSANPAPYLNQLATATTSLQPEELNKLLKELELSLGRTPAMRRQSIVTIDLDLLQYNDQRFHAADWQRPYVKELLKELL